jgi:UDP-glucose 4-epimerase
MRTLVVGGAGFIGSHLVDLLVKRGPVTVFDNFTVGKREFSAQHIVSGAARVVQGDALDLDALTAAARDHDLVCHLAANPEARWGLERPRLDLEQGTIASYNALEACRQAKVPRVFLSSSGTVYGDTDKPCGEMDLGHLPISLYGASKLAGESLVAAYVECFGLQGYICRFGNVVGPRATHGAILDFCNKLRAHPSYLDVLGDGNQAKPYLHVTDCAAGIVHVLDQGSEPLNIYNLAPDGWTTVRRIAELCVAASPDPSAHVEYSGGTRGWPGDVPKSRLIPDKLARLGFRVRHSSDQAVALAVREVADEVWARLPLEGEPASR